ncbi:LNS2 (Lipin/Ned1/Smp2) domain containing protein [Amanita muscaria]
MNYLRGAVSAISAPYHYYNQINPSTLTGAIDVIVVQRPAKDGSTELACSPFHVRFGKWKVLRPSDKRVNVSVNGNQIPYDMKIGEAGEAFFVFETDEDVPEDLITSPLLQPTRTERESAADDEKDRTGAPATHGIPDLKQQGVRPRLTSEPEFLDLDALPQGKTEPVDVQLVNVNSYDYRSSTMEELDKRADEALAQTCRHHSVVGPDVEYCRGSSPSHCFKRWPDRTAADKETVMGSVVESKAEANRPILRGTPRPGLRAELEPIASPASPKKRYAKTLRLTSDQLKALNLKQGPNIITFSLSASGAIACTARIFVWDHTDHVVISDIDGTITKSDGLGHVFAMIGRDWTHLGVAKLYTDITRNGYKIFYLTSRAIGQADATRYYLKGIKQNDYQLPDGPVIMSPDRLMASLHREVIMRKPEMFKMACLRDIRNLFGESNRNPFCAGFGNRITDALSYRSVNVSSSRIFTIDTSGEVRMELLELAGYKSSYIHMTDLVDQMFPPINKKWMPEYTDFNYWRTPKRPGKASELQPYKQQASAERKRRKRW